MAATLAAAAAVQSYTDGLRDFPIPNYAKKGDEGLVFEHSKRNATRPRFTDDDGKDSIHFEPPGYAGYKVGDRTLGHVEDTGPRMASQFPLTGAPPRAVGVARALTDEDVLHSLRLPTEFKNDIVLAWAMTAPKSPERQRMQRVLYPLVRVAAIEVATDGYTVAGATLFNVLAYLSLQIAATASLIAVVMEREAALQDRASRVARELRVQVAVAWNAFDTAAAFIVLIGQTGNARDLEELGLSFAETLRDAAFLLRRIDLRLVEMASDASAPASARDVCLRLQTFLPAQEIFLSVPTDYVQFIREHIDWELDPLALVATQPTYVLGDSPHFRRPAIEDIVQSAYRTLEQLRAWLAAIDEAHEAVCARTSEAFLAAGVAWYPWWPGMPNYQQTLELAKENDGLLVRAPASPAERARLRGALRFYRLAVLARGAQLAAISINGEITHPPASIVEAVDELASHTPQRLVNDFNDATTVEFAGNNYNLVNNRLFACSDAAWGLARKVANMLNDTDANVAVSLLRRNRRLQTKVQTTTIGLLQFAQAVRAAQGWPVPPCALLPTHLNEPFNVENELCDAATAGFDRRVVTAGFIKGAQDVRRQLTDATEPTEAPRLDNFIQLNIDPRSPLAAVLPAARPPPAGGPPPAAGAP